MNRSAELWDELQKQKTRSEEQQYQVYLQYRNLVEAVLAGQITQWPEVRRLMLELVDFGDHCALAWDLYEKLAQYCRENFKSFIEEERPLFQLALDSTPTDEGDK